MARKTQARMCKAFLFLIGLLLLPVHALAQENITKNETSGNVSNDSLLALVQELQQKQAKTEQEAKWEKIWDKRNKHWSFSYITSQKLTLKNDASSVSESSFGVNIQRGRTWYLPKKPLGGMVKFGIDLDPLDFTYVKYKSDPASIQAASDLEDENEENSGTSLGRHQITYGIGIGPSVTVNPIDHLKASAFFHYIPGVGALIYDGKFSWGYQGMCAFGFNVAYRVISLGFETRFGSSTFSKIEYDEEGSDYSGDYGDYGDDYGDISYEDVIDDYDPFSSLTKEKQKIKVKSFLVTLAFRF